MYFTYMHVDLLAITLVAAYNGSDHDKLIAGHEVADASLVLTVAGGQIKLEGGNELNGEKEEGEDGPHCQGRGAHGCRRSGKQVSC